MVFPTLSLMKLVATAEMTNESIEKSSDTVVDIGNRTIAKEKKVSMVSCAANEVIKNGDSSVAEKNPFGDAVKDYEKVADNGPKKGNVHGGHNGDTCLINDKILDSDQNNFVPSIVKIRDGRSDVLEQADQSSSSLLHHDVSSFAPSEDNTCISDIAENQKPPNNVLDDDCVHTGTEDRKTSSSNEFLRGKEKTVNTEVGDPVAICDETTPKLPSPVATKKESTVKATSQSSSSPTEKCITQKRFTRSSLSKANDGIISSSNSNKNIESDSKKRNQLPKSGSNSSDGHFRRRCKAALQETELLDEHTILHHKNNLVDEKVHNRSKTTTKPKLYSCKICKKELSTSQSLEQHVLIHKNMKPFGCHVCHKDFRHLSNYRMHLQKHKAEQGHCDEMQQIDDLERYDKSAARSVNSDGPDKLDTISSTSRSLRKATKSSAESTKKRASKLFYSTKESPSGQLQLSFDQPPLKIKGNAISSASSAVIIRRKVPSELVSEEKCASVKNFKNIESVVMKTSKVIVKLDNLDTTVLKRKLLTPNISIEQPPKKCRVQLSPIAEKYNIKLDEIENIPVDADPGEIDLPSVEKIEDNQLDDFASDSVYPPHDTLSDNELFSLLNDDRDTSTATTISVDSADDNSSCSGQMLPPELSEVDIVKTTILPEIKQSNVVFVETSFSYEMSCYEDETSDDQSDAFDAAFQKVATRRLALLQKRAAENGGQVESRYLIGPLFWCKALRRAQKRESAVAAGSSDGTNADTACSVCNDESPTGESLGMRTSPTEYESPDPFDDRGTNDPTKLQSRAECKFKCLLKRAKILKNLNALNLGGPLFWRRTLQLAGVHRGEDLRTHMNVALPTLEGVEFAADEILSDFGANLVSAESQQTPQLSILDFVLTSSTSFKSNYQQSDDQLISDRMSPSIACDVGVDDVFELSDQIFSSVALAEQRSPVSEDAPSKNTLNDVLSSKTDTALFESLTKLKEDQQQSVEPVNLPPSGVHYGDVFTANPENSVVSSHSQTEFPENYSTTMLSNNYELTGDTMVAVENNSLSGKVDTNYSGSIILNLDSGKSLQLIPVNNDSVATPEAGQNFLLVSDEKGNMQYVVNVTNENYAGFELIGDGGCGDKIAYAIQFDGDNCAALQFVPDKEGIQQRSDSGLEEALTAAVISDPDLTGKELSDFLNFDCGNLSKKGTVDQSWS